MLRKLDHGLNDVCCGRTSLEVVCDSLRDDLVGVQGCPRWGARSTAITAVLDAMFMSRAPYLQETLCCSHCGFATSTTLSSSFVWNTAFTCTRNNLPFTSLSQMIAALLANDGQARCPRCYTPNTMHCAHDFADAPPFIFIEIPAEDTRMRDVIVSHELAMRFDNHAQRTTTSTSS